jgi:hypothetical protein
MDEAVDPGVRGGDLGDSTVYPSLLRPLGIQVLKLVLADLKGGQLFLQLGHFAFHFSQFSEVLGIRQLAWALQIGDVFLELAPQDPKIGIPPHRTFPVFQVSFPDSFHDKVPAYPILF